MKISEFSPQEFDKLEATWKELEKGLEMTWFQTYEWYKIVNKHFIMEKKKAPFRFGTYVLVSDDDDTPLMIAPIQVVKTGFWFKGAGIRKGFYFIGRQGFSDYLNFIYNSFEEKYLDELFGYLKEKYGLNFFCFENVSERCSSYKKLCSFNDVEKIDSLCMTLPLQDDFEAYKKSLSKSMRQNIRTANNRSVRDGYEFSYEILTSIDENTAKQLMDIRAQRLGKKQQDMMENMSVQAKAYVTARKMIVDFSSKPIDVMTEISDCWCLVAKCENNVAAFFYSVYKPENKTVYLLLAGVDKKYEWYSPGITQLVAFMEKEIGEGKPLVEVLDMTRGNEKYKYDLKSDEITTSQFNFYL